MSSPHEIQTHAVSSGIHTENCHTEKDASYAVDGKRGSVSNPSDVDIEAESVPPLDEDNKAPQEVGTYEEGSDTSSKVPFYRTEQFRRYAKIGIWSALFALATGWWIASLVLHRHDKNWVIPFLLYLCVVLRAVTLFIPARVVLIPLRWVWTNVFLRAKSYLPPKWRTPLAGALVVAVFIIGAFASKVEEDNTRANRAVSLFGIAVFLFFLWLTSKDRKAIQWQTVIVGMLMQFIIAVFVLQSQVGYDIFDFISGRARDLLGFANQGTAFLTSQDTVDNVSFFIITVLPAVIFFVAIVNLLYYCGFLQWAIIKAATFFFWSMKVSGAEAVVAAASPFIGQGESAMLIRPFINHLTQAEIHQVMCSGYATIAGSVLISYISMGVNPQAMISSCVMSIPASLAVSKLRWPEKEETLTAGRVVIPEDEHNKAVNALHAFTNGAWTGLKIAATLLAILLCIISFIGLINGLLGYFGRYININDPTLSLEMIVGYICYPIAFLLGVPRTGDLYKVAKLIGLKLVSNEFVAYNALMGSDYDDLSPRSRLIATYALCGFANIASLGNQIGVLNQLAPQRSADVSRIAVSAMLTGALSTFISASVAGLLVTNDAKWTD